MKNKIYSGIASTLFFFFLVFCGVYLGLVIIDECFGGEIRIYQTYMGTTFKDPLSTVVVITGEDIYQTYPGTGLRDYSAPSYTIKKEGNRTTIQKNLDGFPYADITEPALVIEKGEE